MLDGGVQSWGLWEGEGLCWRNSFLGKQPVTLQAPWAVMRSVSLLWLLDILVCTWGSSRSFSAAKHTFCWNSILPVDSQHTKTGDKDKGVMTEAATVTAGSKAGDVTNQNPGRRVWCEGRVSPRDRPGVLASDDPSKAPNRIHRRSQEVLSTSTQMEAPVFEPDVTVTRLLPDCSYLLLRPDLSPCGDLETDGSLQAGPGQWGGLPVTRVTAPSAQGTLASSEAVTCGCDVS